MRSVQKTIFKCSFCASTNMKKIIDFQEVALAGGFFKTKEFSNEKKYPLRVYFCKDCFAVQVVDIINPKFLNLISF